MHKELKSKDIQTAELDIMKEFIIFCYRYKLRYFVYGGTLLGAVRHGGFIPWDDDIDIIMPRPDYDKFIDLIKNGKSISLNYIIESPELDKNSNFLFAKIYDRTIKVDAENNIDGKYIWIDILPLDGIEKPYEKTLSRLTRLRKIFLRKRLQKTGKLPKNTSKTKRVLGKIKRFPLHLIPYSTLLKYFINKCRKTPYETSTYICDTVWARHPGNILKKEWLDETIKMPFEDIEVNVFGGYKHYLENRYGKDYMKLPPKEQQVTHGIKAYRVDENE